MQDVLSFYVPVVATFAVAFASGYLLGMFRGYGQAVSDNKAPRQWWPRTDDGRQD